MNVRHEFADSTPAQIPGPTVDQNPYASPLAAGPHVIEPVGVWQSGDFLVMHKDATLPPRCFRTNVACSQSETKAYDSFSQASRWLICLVIGAIGFALTLFILRLKGLNELGMKEAFPPLFFTAILLWTFRPIAQNEIHFVYFHSTASRRNRRKWRWIGAGMFLGGLTLIPILDRAAQHHPLLIIVSAICFACLLVFGATLFIASSLRLRAESPSGNYVYIRGCGRSFLDSFPGREFSTSGLSRWFVFRSR